MSIKKILRKDYRQTKSLEIAGKQAATNAVRHAKALDLTITYIEDGAVYNERPDGTKTLVKTVQRKATPFAITKGMVLHAK